MGAARRIRQRMRRAVQRATAPDAPATGGERVVNISDPANIVISGNVGEDGAVHGTSTRQTVRVRQDPGGTYEETETTETHFRG